MYEGDWSHEGKKQGIGQLKLLDGSVYEGRFQHGLFNGVGTFKFADGSFYQGNKCFLITTRFGVEIYVKHPIDVL